MDRETRGPVAILVTMTTSNGGSYGAQDNRPYEPYVPAKKSKLAVMRPDDGKAPGFNYTPSATK